MRLADELSSAIVRGDLGLADALNSELALRGLVVPVGAGDTEREDFEPVLVSVGAVDSFRASIGAHVRDARRLIRVSPRLPVTLARLAFWQATAGNDVSATRAVRQSLALAREHVPLLRGGVRLLIHLGSVEEAHHWLARSGQLQRNPWVLSAELAVSTLIGRNSRYIRRAREMAADSAHTPADRAELRVALGSVHMGDGDNRQARRLFREALVAPSENAVAQVEWADTVIGGMTHILEPHLALPRAHEARALAFAESDDWDRCVNEVRKWAGLEPFSTRPFALGGFGAAVYLRDYELSARFSDAGLRTDPIDLTLLNNLAFALAGQGRPGAALGVLKRLPTPAVAGHDSVMIGATRGWIAFADGRNSEGDRRYNEALATARALHSTEDQGKVLAFWMLARSQNGLPVQAQLAMLTKIPLAKHGGATRIVAEIKKVLQIGS